VGTDTAASRQRLAFVKGHGTGNDFVLLPDGAGPGGLTASLAASLCDRHTGLGGDGVLAVVEVAADPVARALAAEVGDADADGRVAAWFMDYRNADGSLAEMCGNGARVFARHLLDSGRVAPGAFAILTRGGVRTVHAEAAGDVSVAMGRWHALGADVALVVGVGPRHWPALGLAVPNPHAVAQVDDLAGVGDLAQPPSLSPAGTFPDGVNVEFVVDAGPGAIALRVHERGAGETLSCGTGAVAAAVATRLARGEAVQAPRTTRVGVPGGSLTVREHPDRSTWLTGPAVLLAEGVVDALALGG